MSVARQARPYLFPSGPVSRCSRWGGLSVALLALAACGGGGGSGSGPGPSPTAAPVVTSVAPLSAPMFGRSGEFLVEGTNLDSADFRVTFSGACTAQTPDYTTATRVLLRCQVDAVGDLTLELHEGSTGSRLGASPYVWRIDQPQVRMVVGNAAASETVVVTLNAGARGIADNDWALHFLHYVNGGFYAGTSIHLTSASVVEGGCYEYQRAPLQTALRPKVTARALPTRAPNSISSNTAFTFAIGPRACDASSSRPIGTIWPTFALNVGTNMGRDTVGAIAGWRAIGSFSGDPDSVRAAQRLSTLNLPLAAHQYCPFASEACYWPDWGLSQPPATEFRSVEQVR